MLSLIQYYHKTFFVINIEVKHDCSYVRTVVQGWPAGSFSPRHLTSATNNLMNGYVIVPISLI